MPRPLRGLGFLTVGLFDGADVLELVKAALYPDTAGAEDFTYGRVRQPS
jgi:hypothetical protein